MQKTIEHLKSEGYNVAEILADGKIHRFKLDEKDSKKSAFYVAYENQTQKGETFHVICYGSWRGESTKTYCSLGRKLNIPENRKVRQVLLGRQKLRSAEQAIIAGKVVSILENIAGHPVNSAYLNSKQIAGCLNLGIKSDNEGTIYVPARDENGKIWSFQQIRWDSQKRFHPGGRIRGCFHAIGPDGSDKIYLCEGFATAASVHMATGSLTICAFNAANLVEVARNLKKVYPRKAFVICADDDLYTKRQDGTPYNPGRESGEKAAATCFGKLVLPEFKELKEGKSDFNDLHCTEGLDTVKKQLIDIKSEKIYLSALGFKEKEYFFTSSNNQQVVSITAFRKSDFLNLMPLGYWEIAFPGAGATKVDWDAATSELMDQARKRGIFESQHIRGAGVWEDKHKVVVNMGDHLIVNGTRTGLGDFKSKYFYTLGLKLPELNQNPLTAKECEAIISACTKFIWKKPDYGYLLAGAMVTTRVCGALPIRPHVWLTGEKGSGKTTLFNRLIYPLIGQPLIFAGGTSSEAGIRQEVCANAVPVLFDEFENNGPQSAQHIHNILDLMRLSWSETRASVIKGSASGVSTSYRARFAAIVTSIRQVSMTDADKSRFATLELGDHQSNESHWRELDATLQKIDTELGSRLFARTIRLLPVLLKNFERMKAALGRKHPGQRFADQYGMLLAGYGTLLQDTPMTGNQADLLANEIDLEEERDESGVSDQTEALSHLLNAEIPVEYTTFRKSIPIINLIRSVSEWPKDNETEKIALSHMGIRVDSDFVAIIATRHTMLEQRVYRGTRWSQNWGNSLKRIPGAEKKKIRINDIPCYGVLIPIKLFTNP